MADVSRIIRQMDGVREAPTSVGLENIVVTQAGIQHYDYADQICELMASAAKARGTGIARRHPDYIRRRMERGHAIIALHDEQHLAGFCYLETWTHGRYVANSGLVVAPEYRKIGLAKTIKREAFNLSRRLFPNARLFGITTSLAVMKINTELGYKPVTFSELTRDEAFWNGCESCPNFDVLTRTERSMCLCTGMLFDPEKSGG